ncbi:MAG: orotate phosphoribosyltransferase [Pseudomonadota bacterium]
MTATSAVPDQMALIELLMRERALAFGDFTLKSGRQSPYFFNLGRLTRGAALAMLAAGYRACLEQAGLRPQVLFGPAYKGIPLAVAVALDWARSGQDLGIAYNRKEAKAHGEGGHLVGAELTGQDVVLLDDVLTAGTALREAVALVQAAGGRVCGVVIALDRQERTTSAPEAPSAVGALAAELGVPVLSLLSLSDVLTYLMQSTAGLPGVDEKDQRMLLDRLERYQSEYCVA